ncbi:MAG: hypothetical protein AAB877_02460 [Patescibacteria group bacterium]
METEHKEYKTMRILLPKGEQNKLITQILEKITTADAAKFCNLSERTIRDWKREKFLMQKNAMEILCNKSNVPLPKSFKERDDYWSANPYKGAMASIKKYGRVGGSQKYQKKKWYEWWNNIGKHQNHGCIIKPLSIRNPKLSKSLAEFTGIILGDGSITKQQILIFTNMIEDKEYGYFISQLIERLFNVRPSIHFRVKETLMRISVSRMQLVSFCNERLGLKTGNKIKMQVDIPGWIKGNLEFEKACTRGLMDTDGCLFWECHNIKSKKYCYPRLSFVTASVPLRNSVVNILQKLGLNPKVRGANQRYIQIEDKEKIAEYFKLIGSSNPKHLNRYYK